jgi:hypothetical protein
MGEGQGTDLHANVQETKAGKQEGQQQAGDKPLLEIGQVVVHKAPLLRQ